MLPALLLHHCPGPARGGGGGAGAASPGPGRGLGADHRQPHQRRGDTRGLPEQAGQSAAEGVAGCGWMTAFAVRGLALGGRDLRVVVVVMAVLRDNRGGRSFGRTDCLVAGVVDRAVI